MINLDPQKLNVEENRKKRRKKLFKYAGFPLFALIFVAGCFLRTTLFNLNYKLAYNDNHIIDAIKHAENQQIANIIETSIPYYDAGVAQLLDEKYAEAEQSFRNALEVIPPANLQCKIYVNLSLSIEMQATKMASEEQYSDAISAVGRAQSILRESNCADSDTKARIALDRLKQKRQELIQKLVQKEQPSDDSEHTSDDYTEMDSTPSDEDIEKALDGLDQSAATLNQLAKPDRKYDLGNTKPW